MLYEINLGKVEDKDVGKTCVIKATNFEQAIYKALLECKWWNKQKCGKHYIKNITKYEEQK